MPELQPLDALRAFASGCAASLSAADRSRATRRTLTHDINLYRYVEDLFNQAIFRAARTLGGNTEEGQKLIAELVRKPEVDTTSSPA